ncbi:MAG TPA: hypothetical protein VK424_04200 [Thermoplasmata archaeon]|nr:hypothetical protein [Thermoplasmata archaeon]
MLLGPGEGVLRSEYAVLLDGHGPGIEGRSAGVLYLTNHRCLFETNVSRGVVHTLVRGRDTVVLLEGHLPGLRNVTVKRPRLGKPRLVIETSHARAAFDVLDPDAWFQAIAGARQALPSPYAPPTPSVTHTIERQVVKVRCRFCGILGNEVDGRCSACGAPL